VPPSVEIAGARRQLHEAFGVPVEHRQLDHPVALREQRAGEPEAVSQGEPAAKRRRVG
jgi:hypothetical protein